jgi:predicted acylesterase/phospholipase RssA
MDATRPQRPPPPLAVCFGGGGMFGVAYLAGVSEALLDGGVEMSRVPALATSAGTWTAGALGVGVRWADAIEILAHEIPRLPDPRPGRLRAVAAEIFGERRAPNMRAVVCGLPLLRRVVLNGADHAIADLAAASSAVPGLLAPQRIGGRAYIDGGVRSLVSADLADPAQHLLVLAPIAGPMFGPAGRIVEEVLRREMRTWRRANPDGKLWLIRPNRAIAALARRPDQLFSNDRAQRCYDLAYEQGTGILERWRHHYGDRAA